MEPLTPAELALIGRNWWGPRTISYSFYVDDDLPVYWTNDRLAGLFGSDRGDVTAISTAQRSAFDAAVSLWTSVANIHLQEETQGVGDILVARIPFKPGENVEISPNAQAAVIRLGPQSDAQVTADLRSGRVDPGGGKERLLMTRFEVERGWRSVSELLRHDDEPELATRVRQFAKGMQPVYSDREWIAADIIRHVRTSTADKTRIR